MAAFTSSLSPFAQHLIAEGLLAKAQAKELADQARADEIPLAHYLAEKQWVKPRELAESAMRFFALPLYNLDAHQTDQIPIEFLSLEAVQKGYAIPLLRRNNTLFLGVTDPNPIKPDEISFATNTQVKLVIVEADKLRRLRDDMQGAQTAAQLEHLGEDALSELDFTAYEEPEDALLTKNIDDTPVVSYINKLMLEAIHCKASDIHFEPYEKNYRVRYRIDGMLHETSRSPVQIAAAIVARLKVIANLDIAERRLPQDGRFKVTLANRKTVDFRISTCPTLYGEKVVLRILDPDAIPLEVDALGMEPFQKELYLEAIRKPQGIVLVTGPTGSGKTISLYTALHLINTPEKNICTVEDPIEIYLPGINQVHMNLKTGLTFAKAMRAFLRQDPDIIMVGEIRDFETADIAIKAAQTGHLVLSTLHTNDAPMAVTRLANIGVESYNIASSVSLIIAQRLIRKLCQQCKQPLKLDKSVLLAQGFSEKTLEKSLTIYGPGQCERCNKGYYGRTGIFEMLSVSGAIRDLILHRADVSQLRQQAEKENFISLREAGLKKVREGITSLEELNRVITVNEL